MKTEQHLVIKVYINQQLKKDRMALTCASSALNFWAWISCIFGIRPSILAARFSTFANKQSLSSWIYAIEHQPAIKVKAWWTLVIHKHVCVYLTCMILFSSSSSKTFFPRHCLSASVLTPPRSFISDCTKLAHFKNSFKKEVFKILTSPQFNVSPQILS